MIVAYVMECPFAARTENSGIYAKIHGFSSQCSAVVEEKRVILKMMVLRA